jgi:hypothetical protein
VTGPSEHDVVTAWLDHEATHDPGDPPCDRCRQLDATYTALRGRWWHRLIRHLKKHVATW